MVRSCDDRGRTAGPERARGSFQTAVQACASNTFEARRDTGLLMLLDTGARWAEMVGIKLADVDLELDVVLVLGRTAASAPFRSAAAGQALDRYLRRTRSVTGSSDNTI